LSAGAHLIKKRLEGAPKYDLRSAFEWTPAYGRRVDTYWM